MTRYTIVLFNRYGSIRHVWLFGWACRSTSDYGIFQREYLDVTRRADADAGTGTGDYTVKAFRITS